MRAYNAAWNYYAGMSEAEIEAEIRRDTVWQRPSWRLGSAMARIGKRAWRPNSADRKRTAVAAPRRHRREHAAARPPRRSEQALAVFDLNRRDPARLKARYKVLVKQHHPDANGGDKAAEEKLKIINQAYATLKASYFA